MKEVRLARCLAHPALILVVAFGLVFAACGGDGDEGATSNTTATTAASEPPGGAGNAVTASGFTFKPSPLEVKTGAAVTWTNKDQILHTVTSGVPATPDGKFTGSMDGAGKTFSFTFDQAGTYKYFCERHNQMTGEVVVS
jgi:plastocyanin